MASMDSCSLMMVEDDLAARNIIVQMIEVRFPGCTVTTADNGQQGLELFKQHNFAVIVTDINMPVMDGLQMAREIRALNRDTAFLVLTAYGDDEIQKGFSELGFCSFLKKPVEFNDLFDAIEKCFAECP